MSKKTRESTKSALDDIKAKLESMDKKLDSILGTETLGPTTTPSTSNAYDDLPWERFKDGEGAWIFADKKGAEPLVDRLKNAEGNTVFSGGFRFSLSKDGKFVTRHPVKNNKGGGSG